LFIGSALLRASETDDGIVSSARKSRTFTTYLKDDSVVAASTSGAVTLTGTVADISHKSLAQDTVESLPGVKSVDNQLVTKEANPAEHSDAWISMNVKASLLFQRSVSASRTDVNVKDGIVTLSGEAFGQAQKELTTEYARDIDNVKEVRNEMTVVSTPAQPAEIIEEQPDDASITARVKFSFRPHRSTRSLKMKVETSNGVVTLGGIASNDAEKLLVTRRVTDITGVKSVINNMTLDAAVSNTSAPIRPLGPKNLRVVSQ